MSALFVVRQADIALTSGLKTVLEVAPPANRSIKLVRWWVEFDGTSASAVPVLVNLARLTATGTGTAATAFKLQDNNSDAIESTGKHTITVEGTLDYNFEQHRIPPTSGYSYEYPLDREPVISSTGILALRVNVGANVNCTAGLVCEE